MKNKFTQKQLEAIESLKCDLDELENKSRRLFQSLIEFNEYFVEEEEERDKNIKHILEFERLYYQMLTMTRFSQEIINTGMEINREEHINYSKDLPEEYINGYNAGLEQATRTYCKKMLDKLTEYFF